MNLVQMESELRTFQREAHSQARQARLLRALRAERRAERAVRTARIAEARATADRLTFGSLATR